MRINLVTPFAEKDAVKALGARWDVTKKCWYITNVADLTPFARWIPNLDAAGDKSEEMPIDTDQQTTDLRNALERWVLKSYHTEPDTGQYIVGYKAFQP
jgi:hypothetical protein